MIKLKWTDAEEIGFQLMEAHPGIDPLSVRFTELRGWVLELQEFGDDPQACCEGFLEAIQMAWFQEVQDQQIS